jgi:tetratricopeptide (TPR) repeat protein
MVTEWAVPVVADLTGDGRPEFVVNADFGIVACDPRSGRMLWRFDDGRTGGMHPLLSDFDGDGFQDIAVQGASSVTVIRGCERPVQWRQRGGAYNMTDVVLLGRPPDSVFVPGTSLRLLDLRDGRILRENPEPHGNRATVRTIGDRQDVVLGWAPFRILRLPSLEHGEVLEGSESTTAALAFDANGDEYPDLLTGDRDVPHSLRAHDGRSLTVLWRSPVARTVHADAAAVAGLLWVPGVAGVHLLEPRDGRERAVWPLGGVASSVRPMGDGAVAATRSGRVARGRLSPRGDSVETLWSVETGLSLPPGAPATSGECVAVASTDGRVALLDGRTGAERWRTAARWPTDGGGSMNDCDGDGFPEVAVCTSRGLLAVLSGADGALLFSFRQGVEFGGASGVWCDIDGDGARELISSGRTGFVTAIRVPAGPPPIVHWPAPEVRSARAAGRATREFLASRRAEELLDRGDLQGLLALADAEPTRWTCTRAAVAARRLGRDADAVRFADEARRRGVRRLDVELARAASLPEPERSGAAVRALAAAPADQLEQAAVGESEKALWASVAAAAAEAAERNGFGDRAILISAQAGSWERIEEIERRAPAASLGRVLLAKSAAAARQNRWSDALAAIQAASEIGSVREDAARRRARLAGEAQASLEAARALAQAGHAADAVPLFDKACCLLPTNAEAWNEAAWLVATSSGVSPQHARAARAWAVVAVETHRKQSPGDGAKLSMYLDTLAAAHFACGDFEAAVRTQREALALPVPAAFLRDMQDALRKYEEALKGGSR